MIPRKSGSLVFGGVALSCWSSFALSEVALLFVVLDEDEGSDVGVGLSSVWLSIKRFVRVKMPSSRETSSMKTALSEVRVPAAFTASTASIAFAVSSAFIASLVSVISVASRFSEFSVGFSCGGFSTR